MLYNAYSNEAAVKAINAKSNDPRTCVTFSEANAALDEYDGVEYLIGKGICGIDLDHCIDPVDCDYMQWIRIGSFVDPSYS